jgi:hypothetical protein
MRQTHPVIRRLLVAVLVSSVGALGAVASARAHPIASAGIGGGTGVSPAFTVVVVDTITPADLRGLAARGAIGLLVPGAGATTSRSEAIAALAEGVNPNAYVRSTESRRALVPVVHAQSVPQRGGVIVVALPSGRRQPNDRRYPIAVVGGGFHGLLVSATTRIPGLVSIADVAPTALERVRGSLRSAPARDALGAIEQLDGRIHANNRLKLPTLLIIAIALLLVVALRPRMALPSILGALVASLLAGAAHVSSEPALVAIMVAGLIGGGLLLERLCTDDRRLLFAIVGVLLLHVLLLVTHPDWVAVTPLGPTQNSRFWGIGNQLETLLIAPVVAGAALSARRYGATGFGLFALLVLVLVTDNRLGSDGGGAIVFGIALAFVGARTSRIGFRGFVTLLLLAATVVLSIVTLNLRMPGPDHLRSAFSHGVSGLVAVVADRVPLAYVPAVHQWPVLLPTTLLFLAAVAYAVRAADARSRDLVLAALLAVAASLLVNDSATYELAGGVAVVAALGRLQPAPAGWRTAAAPVRALAAQTVSAEERSG